MRSKLIVFLSTLLFAAPTLARGLTSADLLGVYELTKFATVSADSQETPWCNGAHGLISYLPGYMGVAINCESFAANSNAAELGGQLFYAGPYEVDTLTGEVLHRVRNYSHPSLNKVQRRRVTMKDNNQLRLVGDGEAGKKIVIEWKRVEKFTYDSSPLPGFYELVGSENAVAGVDHPVPFCTGFHGYIFYTPGGYGSVAINCGEKADPQAVEIADQFGRQYFYAGHYQQTPNLLVQNMEIAGEKKDIGHQARRELEIKDDLLILKGENGAPFVARWRKLSSFISLPK